MQGGLGGLRTHPENRQLVCSGWPEDMGVLGRLRKGENPEEGSVARAGRLSRHHRYCYWDQKAAADETATNRRKNHSRSGRTQQGANDTSGPPLARSSRQICVRKTGRPRLRSIRSTVRTLSFLRVRTHVFPLGHCNFLIFSGWNSIGGTEPIPRSSGSSRLAGAGLLTPAACWVRATLCAQASRQSRMGRGSTQPGEHECSWRYIRGSPLNYEAPVERAHLRCMWAGAQAPAAAITWTRRAEG